MLSILTNFGCHFSCPYCVYRENNISIPRTTEKSFDWDVLELYLKNYKENTISVSGGGDPLYDYENNKWFYYKLFGILDKYDISLELHTSMFSKMFPFEKCSKVVFHCITPMQIEAITTLNKELDMSKTRAVFVVQDHYNKYIINEICKEVQKHNIGELSFRQMIGNDGSIHYTLNDFLKEGHKDKWWYIEQDDYNDYFVGNHIESKYLEIGK